MCEGRTWGVCSPYAHSVKLCPETGDCQEAPMWIIEQGKCTIDEQDCLLSTHYPGPYPFSDACRIAVNPHKALPLQAVEFSVHGASGDEMRINGVSYSGEDAPAAVLPRGFIEWRAGDAIESGNWKLCPLHAKTEEEPTPDLALVSGACTVDSQGCAASPPRSGNVQLGQHCVITVRPGNTKSISVVSFDTEAEYDILQVNGDRYHGLHSPQNVVPSGTIVWTSDEDNPSVGWKFCLEDLFEQPREIEDIPKSPAIAGQDSDLGDKAEENVEQGDGQDARDEPQGMDGVPQAPRAEAQGINPWAQDGGQDAGSNGEDARDEPQGMDGVPQAPRAEAQGINPWAQDGGQDEGGNDEDTRDELQGIDGAPQAPGAEAEGINPWAQDGGQDTGGDDEDNSSGDPMHGQPDAKGGGGKAVAAGGSAEFLQASAVAPSHLVAAPDSRPQPPPAAGGGGSTGRLGWVMALVLGVVMAGFAGWRLLPHWRNPAGYDAVDGGSGFTIDRKLGSETYGRRQFADGL